MLDGVDQSALLGILGVALGALLTRGSAARDGRRSFNSAMYERRIDYVAETTRAAEAQTVIMGNLFAAYLAEIEAARAALATGEGRKVNHRPDAAQIERLGIATEDWRRVYARRYVDGTPLTIKALHHFDQERGRAVAEFKGPSPSHEACERLGNALRGIYLSGGEVGARLNAMAASDYFTGIEGLKIRRAAARELREARERFDSWAAETLSDGA